MVNYMLMIAADLENLTNFQPRGGCDDADFTFLFKVRCGHCGEVSRKETGVSLNETVSIPKGTAHLVQKCKLCGREGTVVMIPGKGKPLTAELSQKGGYTPLMMFDFRGYEPEGFLFNGDWKAESLEGTKFESINFGADGDYSDYDEKAQLPVMISNLRSEFKRL